MNKPRCPDCKGELERKTGQGGFNIWRCTSFPKCKYFTRKLGKENVAMYSIPEPDYLGSDLRQARRAEIIRDAKFKAGEVIVTIIAVSLSAWGLFGVFNWFGESQIEHAKQQQAKMQVDMARVHREAQIQLIEQKAQQEANIEAAKEQARKMEMERFKREIAEHQAQESKKAEFEKQFKPREECNDPMLEWSKSVQCNNEKMTAKEKFYSSH